MLKNMTVKEAAQSKEMWAGFTMIAAGIAFMFIKQPEAGLAIVAYGMKIIGARDKAEGQ